MTHPAPSGLPDLVVATIASALTQRLAERGAGHCVRVDNVRPDDGLALVAVLRSALPAGTADVHVLADRPADVADGSAIPAERAVELRNRKQRLLVLIVPVGSGSAASSLDNSFERIDVADLLRDAGVTLADRLDDELGPAVARVGRELSRSRHAEAWARYVAAVVVDQSWTTVGAMLGMVGLIPDLGGADLVARLSRNARAAKAITRPLRAVSSVADRLTTAGLEDGAARDRVARYLSGPDVDLSDAVAWASALARSPHAGVLTFEQWPLVEQRTIEVRAIRVDPFLKEDGTLRAGTKLKQQAIGDPPYAEVGDGRPASLTLVWKTDPHRTDGIDRWLLEVLPPEDLRDADTELFTRQSVKGDKRRATVRVELAEEDLRDAALLVVRLTALDTDGQPVLLDDRTAAVDESQQFVVRWEAELLAGGGRRASTPSVAQARLDAALDGQDDLRCDSPSWDGGAFSFRLGGRRTALLATSPALTTVQRKLFAAPGAATAWEARGRLGEVIDSSDIEPVSEDLPPALADRRRRLLARLAQRHPRDVVETLDWDDELRDEAGAYCQTYRRALDAAADQKTRCALLTLDTMTLSIATAGHAPIAAVIVLPLHPLRLSWCATYDATLTRWAHELTDVGPSKAERRRSVDAALARRVTPANLPFAVLGVDGSPFVYVREATLGTGIYLDPGEAEPGAAVQAVFDVLGLGRQDVASEVPPALLTERIEAYRVAHPGQEALRVLAYNAGSGELLAGALGRSVRARPDDEDEAAPPPASVEVVAYGRRPSFTDPLPALTDLQREVAAQQVQGAHSYLIPPLGLSVRPHGRLATETSAAHLAVVADLAVVRAAGDAAVPDTAASFRNLLTPAANQRLDTDDGVVWRTAPAVRSRGRVGAADAVDAHRAYEAALSTVLGVPGGTIALTASLGTGEFASLRAAHQRADWVLTVDRYLGIDLYTQPPTSGRSEQPYILDYAPDFLEGLGPRLTVTTSHREEVQRLLADAMIKLDLAAVAESVREVLTHLQVVSGRLAMRLVGRSSLATEAVSLAALMAYLRSRNELDSTIVVPVDAHQEMFGDAAGDGGQRRCDVIVVRATARTLRMECIEVKSRKAAALPTALVDDIVDQLESTVAMLHDTFFRTDPPRIDVELQRARLVGILRHHANRARAMGLLDERRRSDVERLFERIEDGSLVPEISTKGYVVSLAADAVFPREHRGVPIQVLTAADLGAAGFATSRTPEMGRNGPEADRGDTDGRVGGSVLPDQPRPAPRPRPSPRPPSPVAAGSAPPSTERAGREAVAADGTAPRPSAAHEGASGPRSVEVRLGQDAHAADVRWRISTSGSPHMFVLGIPGQGKSVTTRRVLNSFSEQGLPALVLDFHGDMASAPPEGAAVLDASQGLDFSPFELRDDDHTRYPEAAWELSEVIGFVCGLGEIQQNVVYEGVRELYRGHGFGSPEGPSGLPAMSALADAVTVLEGAGRGRNVAARLRPLTDFGLFIGQGGDRGFVDLLRGGVVLDVHNLMEQCSSPRGRSCCGRSTAKCSGGGRAVSCDWPWCWTRHTAWPATSPCRRS